MKYIKLTVSFVDLYCLSGQSNQHCYVQRWMKLRVYYAAVRVDQQTKEPAV